MADYRITPGTLKGQLTVPPSKSQTLRAILFASLAHGQSTIYNYLPSPDTQAMIQACRFLGAHIEQFPNHLTIQGLSGKINGAQDVIDSGNSGIVLRFISAVAALSKQPIMITGDHSIRTNRPMHALLAGLQQLGVSATSTQNNGYTPLVIQGPFRGGKAEIDGEDSQPVSGLLIAAALASGPTTLTVKNPGEKPWIDLTLSWFERLNIAYERKDYSQYHVKGNSQLSGFTYTVPGDFSSAAFPIVAAVITGSELCIHNIDMQEAQGDKQLIAILKQMGASIEIDADKKILQVKRGQQKLQGIDVDINDFVDAIAILAVAGCYAEGETRLRNASVARNKECNRIQCLQQELAKMGADVTETEDGLLIRRSSLQGSAELHSHHDHRMAMALTVAALGATGCSKVHHVDCIAKTYPGFMEQFTTLGVSIVTI
ncbi:MAG: 3-phosphoshikimate 1-carboxyvinyltransferase [Parachlamydiaceae bacterium]|nr:3-phosphoshikimate 1-carboxyvinyltransferase [Parachlamydiaceae bacterium]